MEQMRRYSTIIVALDGTRQTEAILGPARELAQIYGATLVLVRAFERDVLPPQDDVTAGPSVALAAGPHADSVSGIDIPRASMLADDQHPSAQPIEDPNVAGYLNILDNELEAQGLRVEHVDPDGPPAEAIVAEARSRGASLVVMGNRHRSGWERLFKGSTAEQVLRDSPCPVLVVPLD
jgi:nucleotide-binding universal stress UspA family protein